MRDRPIDPSIPVDADTPDDFDPEVVVERWDEIEERGHPLGPEQSVEAGTDRSEGGADE